MPRVQLLIVLIILILPLSASSVSATLEGYAWPPSVAQGDTISLYISVDAPVYDLEIFREGATSVSYMSVDSLVGISQPIPDSVWAVGCNWTPTLTFQIPDSWPSGVYVVELTRPAHPSRGGFVFTVRENDPGSTGSILFQNSIATWQAYNQWGGKSLYDYNSTDGQRSHVVSFKRPYEGVNGVGQLNVYELPFIQWLESEGYAVEYCTDLDTHSDPDLESHYDIFLSIGHDEYWSKEMRDNIEARIAGGGNVAFFGGNTCWWQVRFSEDLSLMYCYKNKDLDPLFGVDDPRVTVNWYANPVYRPENTLTGVSWRNGGYVNSGQWYPDSLGFGDYTAHRTWHWIFAGTGLMDGDEFGYESTIVGYETDGARFEWDGIYPVITGTDSTPASFEILGSSVASRGYATMGIYTQGGTVFNAATTDWAHGLDADPAVQQITRNVLNGLMNGAPTIGISPATRSTPRLLLAQPNPFRSSTMIETRFSGPGRVLIRVYDVQGKLIRTLLDEDVAEGLLRVPWNGDSDSSLRASPGLYFIRMDDAGGVRVAKAIKLR